MRFFPLIPIVALQALLWTQPARAAEPASAPDFAREVRPILSRYCFKCHGPDEKTREGGLRLDSREAALTEAKSGDVAIIPGNAEDSDFMIRVLSDDKDEMMPPPSAKIPLTDAQKDILKRWVAAGANYEQHWAFVPPKVTSIPGGDANHAIDGFIRERLKKDGLTPSQPADLETLCRRLYLDLIGLPPTTDQLATFVEAAGRDRKAATERLVDELLASPHYGERWARKWLDLARYADTNGYEKDRTRSIWPWRDWVVRALNADMPFDRFTVEQIAGDLLPNPTQDQLVATGFHRNTMLNEEGGIDPLEFRYHAMADRVATTGATWMGLTVGCAQCHTHKFDPITHREYFGIFAFLNNADEPELDLPPADAGRQLAEREAKAAKLLAQLPEHWPIDQEGVIWQTPRPAEVSTAPQEPHRLLDDSSVLLGAPGPEKSTITLAFDTDGSPIDRIRLEALVDDSLPSKGPGRVAHGNFVVSEIAIQAAPRGLLAKATPVQIASASSETQQDNFPLAAAFDGRVNTGWAVHTKGVALNTAKSAIFHLAEPITNTAGSRVTVTITQGYGQNHTIGRLKVAFGSATSDTRSITDRRKQAVDAAFAKWLAQERSRAVAWNTVAPATAKSNLPHLAIQPDRSVFASGDFSKSDTYELAFPRVPAGTTAIRLEALPDDRLPKHGPGAVYYEGPRGDFFLSEFEAHAGGKKLPIAKATESFAKAKFPAAKAIDGDQQSGWSIDGGQGRAHTAVFQLASPTSAAGPMTIKMLFERYYSVGLGRFRIAFTSDPRGAEASDSNPALEPLLLIPDAQLTAGQRAALREQFLLAAPELAAKAKAIRNLQNPPSWQTTLVMRERPADNPRPTFIHNRGEFTQPGEKVGPVTLSVLNPLPDGAPKNRLAFAKWLVSPENPLAARVAVNRAWAAFFGRGLVKTTEDFGYQGETPSHPELLDWLALRFVKDGWSMKKLHRLIVTSETYQQASTVDPAVLAKDPENALLARFPRKRLDAEIIRDATLQAAGILSLKAGGPPVRPPQTDGVSEVAYGSPKWEASTGEDRHRRSIYTFVKRTAPFALYNTFDAPTGEACIPRRDVSNTSLQALTLLNDVVFVEAARALGKRLSDVPGGDDAKIREAYLRTLSRSPRLEELQTLRAFVDAQRQRFASGGLDAAKFAGDSSTPEVAAWTALARALFNLDEAVTKG